MQCEFCGRTYHLTESGLRDMTPLVCLCPQALSRAKAVNQGMAKAKSEARKAWRAANPIMPHWWAKGYDRVGQPFHPLDYPYHPRNGI